MVKPIDIECPKCKAPPKRWCKLFGVGLEVTHHVHNERAVAAAKTHP